MIYFVRHGQTDYNLRKLFAGQRDIPLNTSGIIQAKETAELLKNVEFSACFCSPLKRARQTCEEILVYHENLPMIIDERLKERYFGALEGQPHSAVDYNRWHIGVEAQGDKLGIEKITSVRKRVTEFYEEIREKYARSDILIVSHSGIGKISYAYFYGLPPDGDFSDIVIPNARIIEFSFN